MLNIAKKCLAMLRTSERRFKIPKNCLVLKIRVKYVRFCRVKPVPRAGTGYAWHQKICGPKIFKKSKFVNNEKLF